MKQLLLIPLLFISSICLTQITEFRPSSDDFSEDVENFIKPMDKSLAKEISKEIENVFNSKFSENQRAEIASFSNLMLEKKYKLKPDFLSYFNSIIGFGKSSKSTNKDFETWFEVLNKLVKSRNKRRLSNFLEFTNHFFNENLLSESSSVKWKLIKGNYSFSEKNGAFVELKNATLVCYAKNDSSVIILTNGLLNVTTQQFLGNKGTVTWERVELDKRTNFAELNRYRLNMKSSGYEADSALLHTDYLKNPELGKLREKVLTFNSKERAQYPTFNTYNQDIVLKDVVPGVDYQGEFALVGMNFKGGAGIGKTASIIVNRKGKKFIEIKSRNVIINSNKVSCNDAKAIVFLNEKETISQPNCNFSYVTKKKEVTLSRGSVKGVEFPYLSTFHNLSMGINTVTWKEGENKLKFGSSQSLGNSEATFESTNFYNAKSYSSLNLGKKNVAKELQNFAGSFDDNVEISEVDFAKHMKVISSELTGSLVKMGNLGLIDYSVKKKTIVVLPRLDTYLNSRTKEGDYDDLFIQSISKSSDNAVMDLTDLTISVEGIRNFMLSKKKFVKVYPKDGKITLKKDRNFSFSGVINAGRTEYFGSNIEFDYDKFSLSFEKMDTMRLRVYSMHDSIKSPQVRILSKIYNLEGEILVDNPGNKSGKRKEFANFPKLVVSNSPKIYYNNAEILDGIYDSSSFYFLMSPFEMDSLLTYTNQGIDFEGTMFTSDIFPPFDESVKLMNDYVLGFKLDKITDNIYKSKANYNDILSLNSDGLIGKGRLTFLTSSAYSKKIVFFPDSLVAKTGQYVNKSQTLPSVPDIVADNCFITFQPHRGIWKANNIDVPMNIFSDKISQFDGQVTLTEKGMTGKGEFTSNRILVSSKDFVMGQKNMDANKSNFILKGKEENDPPSLEASNMEMALDFEKREGNFKSNTGTSVIEFPINKFTAITDEFDWFMDKGIMDFKKEIDTANFQNYDENKNLKSNFISSLKEHEGLGFFSGFSSYNIDSNILVCKEIPYIIVADARIIPENGTLTIFKKADIQPIYNSQIVANFTNQYHRFSDVEASIYSSKKYLANGNYTVSSDKSINSRVFFDNIEPDEEGNTVAEGIIEEDSNFYLSPQFRYYGGIKVKGNQLGTSYDGKTIIITNCEELTVDWIQFKAIVDTSKIIIPLGEAFADKVSGPTMSNDGEMTFYTAFLAEKGYESDEAFTPSDGYISYNNEKGLFEIGAKDKLLNNKAAGNYISFDNENCSFKTIGELQLSTKTDQFQLEVVGDLEYNKLKDTTLDMNGTMKINFPFNPGAINLMKEDILGAQVQQLIDVTKTNFDLFVNNSLPGEKGVKLSKELYSNGRMIKLPKEMESTMTLFDLNFYWDENSQSFLAQGFANIATLGNNQIFRRCKIYVQIQKRRTGDKISWMIEHAPNKFYYFDYFNGELLTYSSNDKYNTAIEAIPAKDKKIKGGKGQEDFYFGLSSKSKPILFLRNFEDEEGFDED